MGMMIDVDGSIKELSNWRKAFNYDKGDYCYGDNTTKYSLDVAIDTMRKYQQITEIVKAWREVGLDYDSCDAMENIERTIDNGNDN